MQSRGGFSRESYERRGEQIVWRVEDQNFRGKAQNN